MNSVELELPEPPSANRWWRRAGKVMHISHEAQEYKEMVSMATAHYRNNGVVYPKPAAVSLVMTWHRGRKDGDLDKRLGVLLDALQGTIYDSDSQIVQLWARRCDEHKHIKKGHVWVQVCEHQ